VRSVSPDARRVEIIATYDTAGSAKMIAEQKLTDAAAIASPARGSVRPRALKSSIQDYERNTTRFIIIGRAALGRDTRQDVHCVHAGNEPGALSRP